MSDTETIPAAEAPKRGRPRRSDLGAGEDSILTYVPVVFTKEQRSIILDATRFRNAGKAEGDESHVGVAQVLASCLDAGAIVDALRADAAQAPPKQSREMKLPDDPTERLDKLSKMEAATEARLAKLRALLAK